MAHAIWLTEGLSSQRDLIRNIRLFAQTLQVDLTIFASHRQPRHEILSEADFSLTEPAGVYPVCYGEIRYSGNPRRAEYPVV